MYRLTHAPLPGWDDITRAVSQNKVTDSMLVKPWMRGHEKGFWFSRSAWSLYAIAQLRKRVAGETDVHFWFPDYFCNASIAPLRDLGVKVDFYPVTVNGCPDLSVCEAMLESGRPDVIVLVHYFGMPTPTVELAQFARENGAWLVEDAAHVLKSVEGIGESGDFILYSPHKFLPVPDGALLLVQNNQPKGITRELLEKHDFEGLCCSLKESTPAPSKSACKWLIKRLLQKLGVRTNSFQSVSFYNDDLIMSAENFLHPRMSSLAKNLLFHMVSSLDKEENLRKNNYAEWCVNLAKVKVICEGMVPLKVYGIPYLAGFSCDNTSVAEKIYNVLIKAKIPVTTWPDLPPEVSKNPDKYRMAILMRKTRIFFPVHRSVDSSRIKFSLRSVLS